MKLHRKTEERVDNLNIACGCHTDTVARVQRRTFLGTSATGMLGSIALNWLQSQSQAAGSSAKLGPHFFPRAERIICLFQNGGPSQMDLFDPKPELSKFNGKPFPGDK